MTWNNHPKMHEFWFAAGGPGEGADHAGPDGPPPPPPPPPPPFPHRGHDNDHDHHPPPNGPHGIPFTFRPPPPPGPHDFPPPGIPGPHGPPPLGPHGPPPPPGQPTPHGHHGHHGRHGRRGPCRSPRGPHGGPGYTNEDHYHFDFPSAGPWEKGHWAPDWMLAGRGPGGAWPGDWPGGHHRGGRHDDSYGGYGHGGFPGFPGRHDGPYRHMAETYDDLYGNSHRSDRRHHHHHHYNNRCHEGRNSTDYACDQKVDASDEESDSSTSSGSSDPGEEDITVIECQDTPSTTTARGSSAGANTVTAADTAADAAAARTANGGEGEHKNCAGCDRHRRRDGRRHGGCGPRDGPGGPRGGPGSYRRCPHSDFYAAGLGPRGPFFHHSHYGGPGGRDGHHIGRGGMGRNAFGGPFDFAHGRGGGMQGHPGNGFILPPALAPLVQAFAGHPLAQNLRAYFAGSDDNSNDISNNNSAANGKDDQSPEDPEAFSPPVDLFRRENGWILHAALPGAKKEDVGVHWDADRKILSIAGVIYRPGDEASQEGLVNAERRVGFFRREMRLPPFTEKPPPYPAPSAPIDVAPAAPVPEQAVHEDVDARNIAARMENGLLIINVPIVEKEWTEVRRVDIE